MAESTQIRIDLDVKARLETYRDFKRVKSHSDAISFALQETIDLNGRLESLKYTMLEDEQRRDREFMEVGHDRRLRLRALADQFGFRDPNVVIDLLLHHFDDSPNFSRETMMLACNLR
jgi:hypothetical protein